MTKFPRILSAILLICLAFTLISCDLSEMFPDYSKEDEKEIDVEAVLIEAIEKYEREIRFTNVEENEIVDAYIKIYSEHPEYYWLSNGYTYNVEGNSVWRKVIFKPIMIRTSDDVLAEKQKSMLDAADGIVSGITSEMTDYEKALYVHDSIINKADYDNDTYEVICSDAGQGMVFEASTAYGALVSGKAVCSGYVAAYQLVMNKLGIKCGRVTGTKRLTGESHEWNYIVLDGDEYYVDLTWDDPTGDEPRIDHDYFCITDSELKLTHKLDSEQYIPTCTSTKYDYYRINGIYLEEYSLEAVNQICQNAKEPGNICIKFATKEIASEAVFDLITLKNIYTCTGFDSEFVAITYSVASNGLAIYIEVQK